MSSVLVGMFDSQAAAEDARTQLLAAGFSSGAVSLTGGTSSEALTTSGTSSVEEPHHQGAVARFFENLFGGDERSDSDGYSDTYREAFRRGSYGVSVSAADDDELDRAESILNAAGAVDIDERAETWRQEGWTGGSARTLASDATGATGVTGSTVDAGGTQKLQEVEEQLKVGKRAVARGGVRIFSRLTEVPVEESVTLREERANIQRRAVDRPATEADFAAFKEGSIEVREMAEEAVVSKTARVVGEVEIGKTATEREETIRDTVRKTSVEVEQIGEGRSAGVSSSAEPAYVGGRTESAGVAGTTGTTGSTTGLSGTGGGLSGTTSGTTGLSGTGGSANRDPLTGAPGSHPVGTGVGAAAGGVAAGAAAGTVAGPVGTVVGAAVGAVAGGLAGKEVAEKVDPTDPKATRRP